MATENPPFSSMNFPSETSMARPRGFSHCVWWPEGKSTAFVDSYGGWNWRLYKDIRDREPPWNIMGQFGHVNDGIGPTIAAEVIIGGWITIEFRLDVIFFFGCYQKANTFPIWPKFSNRSCWWETPPIIALRLRSIPDSLIRQVTGSLFVCDRCQMGEITGPLGRGVGGIWYYVIWEW